MKPPEITCVQDIEDAEMWDIEIGNINIVIDIEDRQIRVWHEHIEEPLAVTELPEDCTWEGNP